MVFASAVLHNMLTVHTEDSLEFSVGASADWQRFHAAYTQGLRCPSCVRRNVAHCIHQVGFRVGNANLARVRKAPYEVRDELCNRLWNSIADGGVQSVTEEDVEASGAEGATVQAEVHRVRATVSRTRNKRCKLVRTGLI